MAIRQVTLAKPVVVSRASCELVGIYILPASGGGWYVKHEWLVPDADGTMRRASFAVAINPKDVPLIDSLIDTLKPEDPPEVARDEATPVEVVEPTLEA